MYYYFICIAPVLKRNSFSKSVVCLVQCSYLILKDHYHGSGGNEINNVIFSQSNSRLAILVIIIIFFILLMFCVINIKFVLQTFFTTINDKPI